MRTRVTWRYAYKRTLTTFELAFVCSYARKAVFTRGIVDTRATKSTEFASSSDSVVDIEEVEDGASRTSGDEQGSCRRGKRWSRGGMREIVHTNRV